MTVKSAILFAVAVSVALACNTASGLELSKKPHLDLQVGYTFKPPDGWSGVPPEAKFLGEGDVTAGGSEARHVKVCEYRDQSTSENIHIRVFFIGGAKGDLKDAASILKSAVSDWYNGSTSGEIKQEKIGAAPALAFTGEYGKGAVLRCTVLVEPKRAIGIVESWLENTSLDIINLMHKSVATMSIIPKDQLGGMRAKFGKDVFLSDWKQIKNSFYIIEYNTEDEFAQKVSKNMETIQKLYRKLFPTGQSDSFVIKIFSKEAGFHKYSGTPDGVVAYFSPGQAELCGYKTADITEIKVDGDQVIKIGKDMAEEEVFRVMYHEGWHQFLQLYVGKNRRIGAPMWFNEGMAEYFFGGKFDKDGKFEVGLHSWRAPVISKLVNAGKHVPLAQFLRYDRTAYYSNPGVCYAQGWSLCYFMLKSEKKEYQNILLQMLPMLKKVGDGQRAMDKLFEKIDVAKLEQEWLEFQRKMEIPKEWLEKDKGGDDGE